MRILSLSAIASAVLLLALPALPNRAEAKAGVLRCQMPDGTSAYSNRACSDLGGKAVPLPADVLNRIASEQRREYRMSGGDVASGPELNTFVGGGLIAAGDCATSPEQLAGHMQASLAISDVNRLAESFDWTGMRQEQAQPIMDQLDQMASRERLIDAEFFQATIGGRDDAGLMQVTFSSGDGTRVDDYQVSAESGCYFLRYA